MKKNLWLCIKIWFLACLLSVATPAFAHHSVPVNFDMESDIEVTGTLTAIKWVNPHSQLTIDVVNDSGEHETWLVEWNAVNTIKRLGKKLGFSTDDFVVGEKILIGGFKGRQGNSIYFRRGTLASGKEIVWRTRISRDDGNQQDTKSAKTKKPAKQDFGPAFGDAPSGVYNNDPAHTYITFSYDHQGYSHPYLRFRKIDVTLNLNAETPENSQVNVKVDASSVDSGVAAFDGELKGEKFFNAENYPDIVFQSTKLIRSTETTGVMTGNLTIKGQTHPITLDVTFNKSAKNRQDIDIVGFSARGTIKRSDWGMDTAVPFVSDNVKLFIETEFAKAG